MTPPRCPPETMSKEDSTAVGVKWMTRIVPCVLLLLVGYASYVVVGRVCGKFGPTPAWNQPYLPHKLISPPLPAY